MSDQSTTGTKSATPAEQGDSDLLQLVSFEIGAQTYAVPIHAVQEINRTMDIAHVPQGPPFMQGVVNLRRKVVPVVDLRQRLGKPVHENTGDERIVFIEVQGESQARVIGLIVDQVTRVLHISREIIEPASTVTRGADSAYLQGVAMLDESLLYLLSPDKLFSQRELELAASAANNRTNAHAA